MDSEPGAGGVDVLGTLCLSQAPTKTLSNGVDIQTGTTNEFCAAAFQAWVHTGYTNAGLENVVGIVTV